MLLQAARAELQRLKNPTSLPPSQPPILFLPGTTSPSSFSAFATADKKQTNNPNNNHNNNNNAHAEIAHGGAGHLDVRQMTSQVTQAQNKKRQLEELVRKDQSQSSSVNRDVGAAGWASRRGSNSHRSHTSTPANIWPGPSAIGASHY